MIVTLRQLQIACLLSKRVVKQRRSESDSLDEVLFLLLRVHVVSLGVDDGGVGVGGVLGPFGLVC